MKTITKSVFTALLGLSCLRGADLQVHYLSVGQGDACLIFCPDGQHSILIDAADTRYPGSAADFKKQLGELFKNRPRVISMAVASHPHADHIGSMEWVLDNFAVGVYVDNGQKGDTTTFGSLDKKRGKLVKARKLKYINGRENSGEAIPVCPLLEARLLEPWAHGKLSDTNDRSVGVWLKYGSATFLFVGDMEKGAEKIMLSSLTAAERALLDVDVLKVGHHGSDTSSTGSFIMAVSPRIAVISCGEREVGTNTGYKHPRAETLGTYRDWFAHHPPLVIAPTTTVWGFDSTADRWRQQTRPSGLWVTTQDGAVTIETDGATFKVSSK